MGRMNPSDPDFWVGGAFVILMISLATLIFAFAWKVYEWMPTR